MKTSTPAISTDVSEDDDSKCQQEYLRLKDGHTERKGAIKRLQDYLNRSWGSSSSSDENPEFSGIPTDYSIDEAPAKEFFPTVLYSFDSDSDGESLDSRRLIYKADWDAESVQSELSDDSEEVAGEDDISEMSSLSHKKPQGLASLLDRESHEANDEDVDDLILQFANQAFCPKEISDDQIDPLHITFESQSEAGNPSGQLIQMEVSDYLMETPDSGDPNLPDMNFELEQHIAELNTSLSIKDSLPRRPKKQAPSIASDSPFMSPGITTPARDLVLQNGMIPRVGPPSIKNRKVLTKKNYESYEEESRAQHIYAQEGVSRYNPQFYQQSRQALLIDHSNRSKKEKSQAKKERKKQLAEARKKNQEFNKRIDDFFHSGGVDGEDGIREEDSLNTDNDDIENSNKEDETSTSDDLEDEYDFGDDLSLDSVEGVTNVKKSGRKKRKKSKISTKKKGNKKKKKVIKKKRGRRADYEEDDHSLDDAATSIISVAERVEVIFANKDLIYQQYPIPVIVSEDLNSRRRSRSKPRRKRRDISRKRQVLSLKKSRDNAVNEISGLDSKNEMSNSIPSLTLPAQKKRSQSFDTGASRKSNNKIGKKNVASNKTEEGRRKKFERSISTESVKDGEAKNGSRRALRRSNSLSVMSNRHGAKRIAKKQKQGLLKRNVAPLEVGSIFVEDLKGDARGSINESIVPRRRKMSPSKEPKNSSSKESRKMRK